ncbi:dihydroorotate dehydrogenase electron transfer subunit [Kitasatospora sp. NPDC096147]|uniref:iron-sulfur cluster-binding protein n=1 Tax=Kitasatospora sp. NPDC096147 TaxID=3364093 RepID=UPI00381B1113
MAHPVVTEAEVVESAPAGAYRRLVLRAPEVARRMSPGHFATVGPGGERVLRRAFWLHRADPAAGTVELVVAERGPGTRELVHSLVGERLSLIAPLGTPFPLPEGPVSALLVAEGHGSAALFGLAEEIRRRGGQVGFILGAASAAGLFGEAAARELTPDVLVVTADGSAGLAGTVTEVVAQAVRAIDATVVYACGPAPVLAAVAATAVELAARCWTAVEEPMACGTGICRGCVLPVAGADGVVREVRCCVEGPVFDGSRVRWAEPVVSV